MTARSMGRGARSDGQDTNALAGPVRSLGTGSKTLVVYFSRSGNTEEQALFASEVLSSDIYELVVSQPYPADYDMTVDRAVAEQAGRAWPQLEADDMPDIASYQLILLGHPIWNMTPANPMRSFMKEYGGRLAGKAVASFSTHAGYGSGDTQKMLKSLLPPTSVLLDNFSVEDRLAEVGRDEFRRWLLSLPASDTH
ncbi:flavodoxin [Bifidobacterium aemilianum]|uniref:Flavodoxin n=1 Tax=Bifidobacterium aemilianum TaxID=2493120 RepID=A0A366K8V2_9BIFI|nr:flavodoxin [Bifidobacterium aemilianum]RBP98165.1 flavodoxin [Bifidobacterium aemilianum]